MREAPASVGQRLLWLMDHYRGQDGTLNEQVLWRMRAPVDVAALTASVEQLLRRHEMLRTTFAARRGRLVQVIHDPLPLPIEHIDLTGFADPNDALRLGIAEELRVRIDPTESPVRARLWRVATGEQVFGLTMHHLMTDDWSNALVSRDIRQLYDRLTVGGAELPDIAWQYAQWAQWQRELLDGDRRRQLVEYWRRTLAGAQLPALPRRTSAAGAASAATRRSVETYLTAEVVGGLHRLARTQRSTLFPVVLAVFYALLQRRTGQDDLAVASLFANRSRPEVQQTVGFFVNMVVLRCAVPPDARFTDLVRRTRAVVMDALLHQELPYQVLPPDTIDPAGRRVDDIVFQLVGSLRHRTDVQGAELDDLEPQLARSRFALELVLVPKGDGLIALLLFRADQFEVEWATRLIDDYAALAAAAVARPEAPVAEFLA